MKFKMIAAAVAASATAAPALAADLPSVEPVDYVQTCDAFGAGFFVLPGQDTCLRVSGRVRTELRVNNFADGGNWGDEGKKDMDFFARGYVRLDARTQTELGLVRSYTSLSMNTSSDDAAGIYFESAYVQVGGFFVGRDYSQFDVWTG
ncbi:porin, partial [Pseudovibrio flavus]|uniref:porin n=1 Tax=Pseudovibrio flavus TaxID=2529854 RepID=UPI00211C0795